MTNALAFTYVHTVTVDTYLGAGRTGDVWATDQPVDCFVDESTKLIRAAEGEDVTSSARVFTGLDQQAKFKVGSKVTLPSGRTAQVLALSVFDSGALALPTDHIEVALT